MLSIIVFIIITAVSGYFVIGNFKKIRRNILLGQPYQLNTFKKERLKTMLLVAFGQQKMFTRPGVAILHLFLYIAFVITQIELIEIFIDGFTNSHRFLKPYCEGLYVLVISTIEILSVLAFVGTVVFILRRTILKTPRLQSTDLIGWPKRDALLILSMEIILICFIFMMNGADELIHNKTQANSYGFLISQYVGPFVFQHLNVDTLHTIERIGWWGHIIMVFTFLNYLPFSKHLHIILAFPNTYYSNLLPKGKFNNLTQVTDVVKPSFDPSFQPINTTDIPSFGANDVTQLTWKNLLEAYSCTECGRCTSVCPQNITGKKLSPRKIMMDTRDRLVEVGANIDKNKGTFIDDGKTLLGTYITSEEIWACNTCNACVQECPINIDPLNIILKLRQHLVLEKSEFPAELNSMFSNLENNGAPWQFSAADRTKWITEN